MGMLVPEHWAEARRQCRDHRRQITVRRFGWSETSLADAVAMAERRAEEALERLVAGEPLARREPKVAYNGAEGVPIREEVLLRRGESVVTRNAYGARCLNSPCALFVDVDFTASGSKRILTLWRVTLTLAAAFVGWWFWSWPGAGVAIVAALGLAGPLAILVQAVRRGLQGGFEGQTRTRLERFLDAHRDWNVRIYRTPAGLRLLATHRPFSAVEEDAEAFFAAMQADPVYTRMCRNQQCFRARLTAKPWRIGIRSHVRPRRGAWPVAPELRRERDAWIAEYERIASDFAACRFQESLGSGTVHSRLRDVIALHDEASRATDTTLPLA